MVDWPKILGGVLVLAAVTWVIVEIREDGARSIKDAIERQNNDAAASQSDADRSDYDRCLDGGRVWDFGVRKCRGAAPGRRTDLIGARGATPADQRKIDRTVVGICAAVVWTEWECARHGEGR